MKGQKCDYGAEAAGCPLVDAVNTALQRPDGRSENEEIS